MSEPLIERQTVPETLVDHDQWICWREAERDGKLTKIPIDPEQGEPASTTDSTTWTSFETALAAIEQSEPSVDGIGFVFAEADPFVGVDLDDCRDPETDTGADWATAIIDQLDSYTEVSPSGTGYHVLVGGDLPEGRNRKGDVELYDSARFFTVTGDHVSGTPAQIEKRSKALAAVHDEYVHEDEMTSETESGLSAGDAQSAPVTAVDLSDEDLLKKARSAANGAKFSRLWSGDTSGYQSHSEADMALCFQLAFWTGGDASWMDKLFRRSGLMRAKWDEQHYADGSTYGEKTIQRAIAKTTEFYEPPADDENGSNQPKTHEQEQTGREPQDEDEWPWERERAYLQEQNRLLKEKLAEYETTIEKQEERIETLETELDNLQAGSSTSASHDDTDDQSDEGGTPDDVENDQTADASLWSRAKGFISNDGR